MRRGASEAKPRRTRAAPSSPPPPLFNPSSPPPRLAHQRRHPKPKSPEPEPQAWRSEPMARGTPLLLLLLVVVLLPSRPPVAAAGEGEPWGGRGLFVLEGREKVVESEGGEVRVVRGVPWPPGFGAGRRRLLDVGFITMEPKTLFVPQYLDSSLTLFVRRGEVKVGWIYEDALVERNLTKGDVLYIDAGSAFYMLNTGRGQRLQIICSIDPSETFGFGFSPYQAFYIGGGRNPRSVLAGFGPRTLTAALNVTPDELAPVLTGQTRGPIVYVTKEHAGREEREREGGEEKREEEDDGESGASWSWRKLLETMVGRSFAGEQLKADKKPVHAPDAYNLYDRKPDFQNKYGWSIAVDEHEYTPLKNSDIGIYLVNLTAGSMLAPHWNPRATEYGIVLAGTGTIQVVFPNGSLAMGAPVAEGDVFWIPRFFPFCQIASRNSPLVFFGFTTSARRNHPQFIAGASSVLRAMLGPELAAGFGVSEAELSKVVKAQNESLILPYWPEPKKRERGKGSGGEEEPSLIKQMTHV